MSKCHSFRRGLRGTVGIDLRIEKLRLEFLPGHLLSTTEDGIQMGLSVDDVVDGYVVPDRYQGFDADPQSVRTVVQHIYNEQ